MRDGMKGLVTGGAILIGLGLVTACHPGSDPAATEALPPFVLTAPVEDIATDTWSLTGAIRPRYEPALSFRIAGEIQERLVNAGERVAAGQVLFRLDPRDVTQQRLAAEATVARALAEQENAERERARLADLIPKRLASEQDYDRAVTAASAAEQGRLAAEANLEQARNAMGYATLAAPRPGVILEVAGEAGQVVTPGQVVARLAEDGPLEVEVYLPEDRRQGLPTQAEAHLLGRAQPVTAELREIAGSADPITRTWRARFRLPPLDPEPGFGTTVTLLFASATGGDAGRVRVPSGAILERGEGPLVWRLEAGRVVAEPVTLLRIVGEHAEIRSGLAPGTPVVALGVQLLQPGQAVRVRAP